jgi:hypothetical protein
MSAVADIPETLPHAPRSGPWRGVDALVDRTERIEDLRAHGLHLLAAARLRATGRPVPARLETEERAAAFLTVAASVLLERARDAYDGRLVLVKGPELAARYPEPARRPFSDLDLLADDAPAAQAALVAAGFTPVGPPAKYAGIHHLRPLRSPGLPLAIEVHERPKWIAGQAPPPTEELLAATVPSACGVAGIEALEPAHHALLVAVHSWAHAPLARLLHLVDVAALEPETDAQAAAQLARAWGLGRGWEVARAAAASALDGGPRSLPERLWARSLRAVRERTVAEAHLEDWLAPFWALPAGPAARTSAGAVAVALRPRPGEPLRVKLRRSAWACRHAFEPVSRHTGELGRLGIPMAPTTEGRRP